MAADAAVAVAADDAVLLPWLVLLFWPLLVPWLLSAAETNAAAAVADALVWLMPPPWLLLLL